MKSHTFTPGFAKNDPGTFTSDLDDLDDGGPMLFCSKSAPNKV